MNNKYVKHLQDLVKIPTVSNLDVTKVNYENFFKMHKILEKNYPMIHKRMEKCIIGKGGLLFHYDAKVKNKLPILLMGHQDVVPEGDLEKWVYPPYSGKIAKGCIWGRGTGDCKHVIMAEMEAVEELFQQDFEPDFDIYLSYSDNEEVQVEDKTAVKIVDKLFDKGIKLGCVFDEGSGIQIQENNVDRKVICQVEMGEKAYNDVEIFVESEGGHAMYPGQGSALGLLSKAAVAIEENPFKYRLTPLVAVQLKAMASGIGEELKKYYYQPEKYFEQLCNIAKENKELDALLHSTMAITMAKGSNQSNVLPERASMIINCRLLEGDTSQSLIEHIKQIVPKGVNVKLLKGENPEKAASTNSFEYELIKEATKKVFGEEVYMVPGLLPGGTDCRFYSKICDNTFRHTGFIQDNRWSMAHKANERIPCDVLEQGVEFYKTYIKMYKKH